MNGELKACPFCGSDRMTVYEDGVWCEQCSAHHDIDPPSKDRAIAAWNTRPTPAPGALPDAIDAEAAILDKNIGHLLRPHESTASQRTAAADYIQRRIHALLRGRAYAEQCRAGVWMPIETAPKDELILVGPTKRMGICVAMNHSRDGWVTETTSEWYPIYEPTHWMPLPAPPALQSAFADDEGVR